VRASLPVSVDMSNRFATYWFINGRNGPDTLLDAFVPWLPTQPYNAAPRLRPRERLMARVINAGLDMHPFHLHGNHAFTVARDGFLLDNPGSPAIANFPNLTTADFTIQAVPGQTVDAIWTWTGDGLGWDIYGHAPGDPCNATFELCPPNANSDHGTPLPTVMPDVTKLAVGGYFSGSPFLGQFVQLPYDLGGMNVNGGLFFMWHSHNEKELTNYNIFPGGMMTMVIVEPPEVTDIQ
jgi:manganese oxidase